MLQTRFQSGLLAPRWYVVCVDCNERKKTVQTFKIASGVFNNCFIRLRKRARIPMVFNGSYTGMVLREQVNSIWAMGDDKPILGDKRAIMAPGFLP